MANGTTTTDAADEYVLLSSIRPGLKREFAFAMKSHSENYGLCGRTRARRPQMSPEPLPVNKKSKSADLGIGNEDLISNVDEEESSKSDVVDPGRAVDESVKSTGVSSDLKPKDDDRIADKDENENVISSVDNEEIKTVKKVVLKKFPTKLKELLETGLLEGSPVRYVRGSKVYIHIF